MNPCNSFYAHDPALFCTLPADHEGLHAHQNQNWQRSVADLLIQQARTKSQEWNQWPSSYNYTMHLYTFPEPGRFAFLTTKRSDIILCITGIEAQLVIRSYVIAKGWCEPVTLEQDFKDWWIKVLAEWPAIRFWLEVN